MTDSTLSVLRKLYSASSQKVIITDSSLEILWTTIDGTGSQLSKDMFSVSNAISDCDSIFPVTNEKRVYLELCGVGYTATITPLIDEDALVITLNDSLDAIKSGLFSGAMASLQNTFSQIRQASAEMFSLNRILQENADIPDNARPIIKRMDNQCYRLLAAQTNSDEVFHYANAQHSDTVFDISAFTTDICYLCTSFLRGTDIEIICEADKALVVKCDSDRYLAVLLNLIENSVTYNLSDKKQVKVCVRKVDESVRISVIDNGTGMSADEVGLISTPFASCKFGSGKSGIGLFAAQQFAKTYSGTLTINSIAGESTGVHLKLPLSDKDASSLRSPVNDVFTSLLSPIAIRLSKLINK